MHLSQSPTEKIQGRTNSSPENVEKAQNQSSSSNSTPFAATKK